MWLVVTLLLPLEISQACGPSEHNFHGYSFVKMEILPKQEREGLAPLFLRFDNMYQRYFESASNANQNDNLAEWHWIFCGDVDTADLDYIVYKAPIGELELLNTATGSKSLQVPVSLQGNTFAQFVFKKKCGETIEYLVFAKQCEPYVTASGQWEAPPRDKEAMQRLIGEGRRQFKQTKSNYIRLRYAYQLIRLAHYAGLYEQVLELYEELIPKVDKELGHWEKSIIPWWILGHKAGALRKLGDNVQASYLYMQIFLHCPGRRASAYQSFFIKNNEQWEACLRLCQSDRERAALYAIRAAEPNSRAVEEMEKIYAIDPTNENLEVLLVQEMRKVERNLLGLEFNSHKEENKRFYKIPKPSAGKYVIDLQKFVRRCRQEGKVARPVLWQIAEGYLEFLAGDFYAADLTFREAARVVDDKVLKEQLDIFQLALKIAAFEKPTKEVENFAYSLLMDDPRYRTYSSLPDYLKDKMTWLYNKAGQTGKAFLSQYPLKELKPNPQMELLNDLLATALKPDQSKFERLLMDENPTNELLDMKATLLMSEGQMEAAFETFKRIPAEQWNDYGQFDPFRETLKDCISCYVRTDSISLSSYYNKGELLEALLDLEYKAKGDLEGAAAHYYKLGLAYYNMSYFGYAWRVMDYFRSGSTWSNLHRSNGGVYSHFKYPFGNKENVDLSRALYFFEKARLNANTPELAAKASYQAARCEQKIYFQTDAYKPEPCCNRIPRLPTEYLVNFSRLKEQYAETEFYKLVIKECKYFAAYAAK